MRKLSLGLKTFTSLLLCAALGTSCVGCKNRIQKVSAAELSADYSRLATENGEITEEFKKAMADFSLTLFNKVLTKDDSNDLVSPLSAVICLAMVANGADGETLSQMEEMFGMDIDTLNKCMYAYVNSLYTADDCKLNIADSIWFQNNEGILKVKPEFLQANADWYNSEIYAAPFDATTLNDINNWCSNKTDGMIKKILDELDADTVMILINAIMFDAEWQVKFKETAITDGTFHNYDGSETTVKMLNSSETVFLENDLATGFAKNYAGGKYSFVGLLPNDGVDVYDLAESLTGENWLSLWDGSGYYEVDVQMPEFTYESNMPLNDILKAMGMVDAFSDGADFSKMAEQSLCVSNVQQKVYIKVDRNGTKAAAVTWGEMQCTAVGPEYHRTVILDRPFVYAIVDNETGLPLFLGVVTNL